MASFVLQQDVSSTNMNQVSEIVSNSGIMRPLGTENSEDISITFENQNQLRATITQQQKLQIIKTQIDRWIITAIAYLIFFILIALHDFIDDSVLVWEILFLPLWLLDLYIGWSAFKHFRKANSLVITIKTKTLKRIFFKDIIDTIFIVSFKVVICISLRTDEIPPIIIGIPLYLGWISRAALCAWPKADCWSFSALIRSTGRVFRLLTCATITMKIQGIIKWDWTATFWPFWVIFALLLLINLGVWLLFFGSLCSYIMGDSLLQEMTISFWLFYVTSGACVVSSLIAFDLGQVLQQSSHKEIWKILMPVILYLLILLIFTKFVYSHLPNWWNAFFQHDQVGFGDTLSTEALQQNTQRNQVQQQNELNNSQNQQGDNQQDQSSGRNALRRVINQIKKPPKYLVRLSSTYFGRPANLAFAKISQSKTKTGKPQQNKYDVKETKQTDVSNDTITKDDGLQNTITKEGGKPKKKRNISMPIDLKQFADTVKIPSLVVSPRRFRNCCVCFEAVADAVIMECGHGGICYNCSLEMWKSTGECHLCRDVISQVVQCDFTKPGRFVKVFSATRAVFGDEEDESEGEDIEVVQQRANQNAIQQRNQENNEQINDHQEIVISSAVENQQESCTNISILSMEDFIIGANQIQSGNSSVSVSPSARNQNIINLNQ